MGVNLYFIKNNNYIIYVKWQILIMFYLLRAAVFYYVVQADLSINKNEIIIKVKKNKKKRRSYKEN